MMKLKLTIILLILCFFSSCILFKNENGYKYLDEFDKGYFKEFNIELLNDGNIYSEGIYLYEINSEDIKLISENHKYTMIIRWTPYCQGNDPEYMNNLERLAEKYKKDDLVFLLISTDYHPSSMIYYIKENNIQHPVYVFDNLYYGKSYKQLGNKLNKDLLSENNSKRPYAYYVFKGKEPVFYSNYNCDLDSLLSSIIKEDK